MRTVKVGLLNEKALDLLKDLEGLRVITLIDDDTAQQPKKSSGIMRFKGVLAKQPNEAIEAELKKLRDEWE